jgi:hypothetical protein
MNMSGLLPQRWRTKREEGLHNEAILAILNTPPIQPKNDGLVIFSMIGTSVLLPYLVAVKSLWQQLQRGRVAILDDGSLTAQDRAILAQHCGDPQILRMQDIPMGNFPKGGKWERLLTVLDHRAGEYWLHLDSSTVTLGPLPEVERAISANRSFILLADDIVPDEPVELSGIAQACIGVEKITGIESAMGRMAPGLGWKYVRGTTGFAGFAAGNAGRELAGAFVARLKDLVGSDEASLRDADQIAASFLIANEGAPVCLPQDKYRRYRGEPWSEDCQFLEFTGDHRHANGGFIEASQRAIGQISR